MAKTKFKITGKEEAEKLARNLSRDANLYKRSLKLSMWRALSILEAAILIEMGKQLRSRSGMLRNSIPNSKTVEEVENMIIGSIGPVGVVYAAIHEFGGRTRPHIIRPRYKKALSWISSQGQFTSLPQMKTSKTGGQFMTMRRLGTNKLRVFTKEVKHPGSNIPARPYIRPAILKNREKIAERFGLMISATFKFD